MPTVDFETTVVLAGGSNSITVTATDDAGNTGSDSVTVSNAEGFDPRDLGNLRFWLRAGDLGLSDGDALYAWEDARGGVPLMAQYESARHATFKTGVVNGEPVARFASGDALNSVEFDWDQFTVFAVARSTSGTYPQHVVSADYNDVGEPRVWLFKYQDATTLRCVAFDSGDSPHSVDEVVTAGDWSILSMVRDGSDVEARVNGSGTTASAGTTPKQAAQRMKMASRGNDGSDYEDLLTGDIAEVIVYSSALSSADVGSVESYLSSRYNITI